VCCGLNQHGDNERAADNQSESCLLAFQNASKKINKSRSDNVACCAPSPSECSDVWWWPKKGKQVEFNPILGKNIEGPLAW